MGLGLVGAAGQPGPPADVPPSRSFTDDEIQSAIAVLLRAHSKSIKQAARLDDADRHVLSRLAADGITAAPPTNYTTDARAKRWVRDADSPRPANPYADVFHSSSDPLGSLGVSPPPIDLIKDPLNANVLFERIGRTAPSVGYAHLKLDLDTLELVRGVDHYQAAIRAASRLFEVCSVRQMFANNSAAGSFTCTPHVLDPSQRTLHVALADHFHSYVALRASVQSLRDVFRPMSTLYEDFLKGKGPTSHWMEDLRLALQRLSPRAILTTLFAGAFGAAITQLLWSFFTPSESANAAHIAVVAEHTVATGESLEGTFSIINEVVVATDALTDAMRRRDRFVEILSRLNFARQALERRVTSMRAILDSASSGRLSSSAFQYFDLRKVAAKIKERATVLRMSPLSKSYAELLQSDCSLFKDVKGFSVTCHLPLLRMAESGEIDQLEIFRLADLPISLSPTLQLRVAPRSNRLLAVSPMTGEWRTMSSADLYHCTKLGTFFLCPLSGVLRRPLPNDKSQDVSDDACLYHLYHGNFLGASASCDAAVDQKRLGVTQTGPFSFAAYALPNHPVLGEAKCPNDPSFRRTMLIANLTTFQMPPACHMTLGTYKLYSADQSFIREASGTQFTYPFPRDILAGNMSHNDLEVIQTSIDAAKSLSGTTRLEHWKNTRKTAHLISTSANTGFYNTCLAIGAYLIILFATAFQVVTFCRFHRRITVLESTAPIVLTPRPRRGDVARRHSVLAPSVLAPSGPPPGPISPSSGFYPLLPSDPPSPSPPVAVSIRNGEVTSNLPRSQSSPPPYMSVGSK